MLSNNVFFLCLIYVWAGIMREPSSSLNLESGPEVLFVLFHVWLKKLGEQSILGTVGIFSIKLKMAFVSTLFSL